jgi:Tol biopolymer transport system component
LITKKSASSFLIGGAALLLTTLACLAGPVSERILFVASPSGLAKIYIVRPDGKDLKRLTHGFGYEREPECSTALRCIAYRGNMDGNDEIYRCNLAGNEIVRLTHSPDSDRQPSWSPDGKQIVFATQRWGEEELAIMDSVTGDRDSIFRLTWDQCQNSFPAWSPDGKWIAYCSCLQGQSDLYLITPDGKTKRRLTRARQADVKPGWSPDGKRLVYQTQRGPRDISTIAIYTVETGEIQTFKLPEIASSPTWSADGQSILYVALGTRLQARLSTGDIRKFELPRLNANSPTLPAQESDWTPFPFPW